MLFLCLSIGNVSYEKKCYAFEMVIKKITICCSSSRPHRPPRPRLPGHFFFSPPPPRTQYNRSKSYKKTKMFYLWVRTKQSSSLLSGWYSAYCSMDMKACSVDPVNDTLTNLPLILPLFCLPVASLVLLLSSCFVFVCTVLSLLLSSVDLTASAGALATLIARR